MKRIVIIGTSCSGKSHLAKLLSSKLSIPHVELDQLHWGPNWKERPRDEFARRVKESTSGDSWVVDGNYSMVRDFVWPRATTIIWLNYSFPLVLYRSVRRSITRILSKEALFSGNVETFKQAFLSKDSIILWVVKTHHKKRKKYTDALSSELVNHAKIEIFENPKQASEYVKSLYRFPVTPS
jgi:adenylate kinase family enzyme